MDKGLPTAYAKILVRQIMDVSGSVLFRECFVFHMLPV
jgi:hypothetical protein